MRFFSLWPLILSVILSAYWPVFSQSASDEVGVPSRDLIHFGDLIDVDVLGSFEFDWRGRLTPEGFLDGPDQLENPVRALCRSESAVAEDIAKGFSTILREPKVIVKILDRSKRPVVLLNGAVRLPQRFQMLRPVKLNELIVFGGGITDSASGQISIFRSSDLSCAKNQPEGQKFAKTSLDNSTRLMNIRIIDLIGGIPEANPEILSGDIVTVGEAFPVYVIGGVNNPRHVPLRSELTVLRAIASAGGPAKNAELDNVTVFRRDEGRLKSIKLNLKEVESGHNEDIILKPFDIVDVGQKGVGERKFPPRLDEVPGGETETLRLPLTIID